MKENKKFKVFQKLQEVLWSYDARDLDLKKIENTLLLRNYGTWKDSKLLYKLYSKKEIKR